MLRQASRRPALRTKLPAHSQTPDGPAHPLLRLQRAVGNRATAELVESHRDPVVQRRIASTTATLDSALSRTEKVKAEWISGTYQKLRRALADYHRNTEPDHDIWYIDVILGLTNHWLATHAGSKDKSDIRRRPIVEQLEAEAMAERGRVLAQQLYVKQAAEGNLEALSSFGKDMGVDAAKDVAKGKSGRVFGTDEPAIAFAKKFGLTAAEISAIRIYTLPDYTYINPATANSDSWMKANITDNAKSPVKDLDRKKLREEGALHAGVMMQALAKIPPWKGTTYRGSRSTAANFKENFLDKKSVKFGAFTSSAKKEMPARQFSNGFGDVPPKPNQDVSVFCMVELANGRDINVISAAAKGEEEVLILPGAEFEISSVTAEKTGPEGNKASPATAWYTVRMKQVK